MTNINFESHFPPVHSFIHITREKAPEERARRGERVDGTKEATNESERFFPTSAILKKKG